MAERNRFELNWEIPAWLTRKLALVSMAAFLVACSDSGCDCEGFETAKFPEQHYDKTLQNGGQVRVTQSGLDFVEGQVPTLIGQFMEGGLSFCVPPSEGTADICTESTCDDGSDGCQVTMEIDDAQLNPEPTDTLNVDITIGDIGGGTPTATSKTSSMSTLLSASTVNFISSTATATPPCLARSRRRCR